MDVERQCLEAVFKRIPYSYLLKMASAPLERAQEGHTKRKQYILKGLHSIDTIRTEDEFACYLNYIEKNCKEPFNYFPLVFSFAQNILVREQNQPVCRYEELLRWREISHHLGQDIFTTAFLANLDSQVGGTETQDFSWKAAVSTDNKRLHRILSKGMVENHFHLNGSTQIFPLSWVSLMNHIYNRGNEFNQITMYLTTQLSHDTNPYKEELSLHQKCILASYIRLYLFLQNQGVTPENTQMLIFTKYSKSAFFKRPELYVASLQRAIEITRNQYGLEVQSANKEICLDYALDKRNAGNHYISNNRILAGERKFMYHCFSSILKNKFSKESIILFHLYLVLKNTFRDELVQTNRVKGFQNFSNYEERKEVFIENYQGYKYEQMRLAINATCEQQPIKNLEMRMCPKDTAQGNRNAIAEKEKIAEDDISSSAANAFIKSVKTKQRPLVQSEEKRAYTRSYVFHFPKRKDAEFKPQKGVLMLRHGEIRENIRHKTEALLEFLKTPSKERLLLRGIDACATELGCRPEVFAPAFRRIKHYTPFVHGHMKQKEGVERVCASYHAGEDFYDVADGLRAIDEAILFCSLERNDRIGHALALGINAEKYYHKRCNSLVMPKQELLDNLVWLLQRSTEFNVSIPLALAERLRTQAYILLREIYVDKNYSIQDYYYSWKLRGDIPEYYYELIYKKTTSAGTTKSQQKQYLRKILFYPFDDVEYALNTGELDTLRDRTEVREIIHHYLFNAEFRKTGDETHSFKVEDDYLDLVCSMQKALQNEIAQKGIMIETNPSSNILIGPVYKYAEHPIFTFNSNGLQSMPEGLLPLQVSINTDDQGVFDTLLENEYALLACALEKECAKSTFDKYTNEDVYHWLDYVREMGLQQVF